MSKEAKEFLCEINTMDKKDKIVEILESWEKDNGHYFNSISGSDYENIADEVVKLFAIFDVSGCFPSKKEVEEKHTLNDSWGNTSHPDECYRQGLKDMYESIVKELNNR
tara:strand:- start:1004 stop:1330 length:327 start_codon:yes stop_codon:yes gene_type:complete